MKANAIEQVVVHPLVLLSIVDHYNRVAKDTHKRVVGVLLGETSGGRVDVTNSYAGTNGNLKNLRHDLDRSPHRSVLLNCRRGNWSSRFSVIPPLSQSLQFLLKKMTRIQRFGSWITTTTKRCSLCLRRSTVRLDFLLVQNLKDSMDQL